KLPEGASIDRTERVVRRMTELAHKTSGVRNAVAFAGLNSLQFTNTPNTGTLFFGLDAFHERTRSAAEIAADLNAKFAGLQEGFAFAIKPPAVLGIGTGSGFSMFVQDRAGLGTAALNGAVTALAGTL